jgi:hypothetical protein
VPAEDLLDGEQEVEFREPLEDAAFGPACVEAEHVAPEEPGSGLFDTGLFEIGRKRGLARGGGVAGEDITAGVGESGS